MGLILKETYPYESEEVKPYLVPPENQPEFVYEQDLLAPEFFNLGGVFVDRHVEEGRGGRTAIIFNDTGDRYTYQELKQKSDQVAAVLLSKGLQKGDRVAFRFPNCPEAIFTIFGIWKAGGIVVLTPPQARKSEIAFFINDTRARFFIVHNKGDYYTEAIKALEEIEGLEAVIAYPNAPDTKSLSFSELLKKVTDDDFKPVLRHREDVAVVWHTGGTTGVPKACYHTTGRIMAAARSIRRAFWIGNSEIWVYPMPVGHAAGFLGRTITAIYAGVTILETEDMNPAKIYEGVKKYRATSILAMPITWARFLDICKETNDFSIVEHINKAYAPFLTSTSENLYNEWKKHGVTLMNTYGSTAFATWILMPPAPYLESVQPPALGRSAYGYTVEVVDNEVLNDTNARVKILGRNETGILAVKGPTGLTYWNRPQKQLENQRDGWNVIDDSIEIDDHGMVHYMGRADFLISTSGYKVAPVEVENVLTTHPAVKEVAVVGSPDPERGEVVMAYIVLNDGYQESDALIREFQDYVKERISPYKYPRRIEFLPELPRDLVGKIQVKQLRQMQIDKYGGYKK